MNRIPFWKMSGSGNDFVLIDNRRGTVRGGCAALAKNICDRHFGVGADGLLLLENVKTSGPNPQAPGASSLGPRASFRMVYYNADGSRADMCGNGARCIAWFAHERGAVGKTFRFMTDAFPVDAEVQGRAIRITLADAKDYRTPHPELRSPSPRGRGKQKKIASPWGDRGLTASLSSAPSPGSFREAGQRPGEGVASINTGVPHAVVFVKDLDRIDVQKEGVRLRFHKVFGPMGTNVNFVQKLGPNKLRVRTYERGVEGETLACGTGVTASAIAAVLKGLVKRPVRCIVAGGDTLKVNFTPHPDEPKRPASNITLEGPVRLTFKGEVYV